uniref:Tricorn protease homolog n=1 Tax=Prevotella sp. GTC17260 TaxID=3236796 RepID=A0AB33JG86_9BACT
MANMKKQLLLAVALASSMWASAQTNPLWMRYSSISPNGQTIAFSYKGDIFTVPVTGGNARQITTNAAYDSYPVWSPDGRKIAFASTREGSLDVYVVNENGGVPTRLTYNSGDEIPMAFSDGMHVLFSSSLMPTAKSIIFASAQFPQVYQVSTEGMARPTLFSGLPMCDVNINSRGDLLYHDQKGYEDPWRKHHTSPITRDIWMKRDGKYSKLTSFNGEDRNAVWGSGDTYYYLSEESGTFNVYRRNIDGSGKQQLTSYKGNPVRFLSRSNDGTLCYGYDGEIYTLREGQQPKKVAVNVISDRNDIDLDRQTLTRGATEIAVSPSGKEIAFVLHGDVYVTSVEYKTTKQITNTPEQERSIDFAPDGRSIVYASERNGLWQIYQSTIKKKEEKLFTYATEIEEEQLVKSNQTSFQPRYSPDGKSVAYLENRTTLRAVDVKSHALRTLMDGKYMYSYSDGDQWFEWSPDSKWLLSSYIGTGGWNNSDVALVDASGSGVIHDVTESGYNDGDAKWVLGGKAMLFQSDRAGFRSHGSWGSESDAYLMFFDLDAYEQFKMTKEEKGLFDEAKKKDKKDDAKKDEKKPKKVEPLKFDLDNCRDRVIRLTVNSSHMGDAILSPGGDTLYYQASFEGGYDLWRHVIRDGKTEIVAKNIGSGGLKADKNFKNIYLCNSTIKKFDVGKNSSSAISFEARFDYQPYKERRYLFNHVWQQVKDKFYDVNLHGVDWDGYRATYERFLPYINNGYDFRDMLSELLGELNASHTGARFYADGARLKTAVLGLFFDQTYTGDGLKVEEVIKRGPFAVKNTKVQRGSIIEAIDGQRIEAGKAYDMLLDGKAGKPVRVTVNNGGKSFDVTVRPISKSQQDELLYKRWVDRNRAMVDSLSGGRLAYVHVKAMNSESFRTVFSELLSDKNRQKEAVIVDERHNGGGWLHDDLCTLLSGKQYQSFVPRGQFIGYDPWNKWVKPSCVMVCEDDYSNGHGFPFVYKTLGIGKVIGTPVAGTMTAVWWERLMDNQMVFGIPQVGCRDMNGVYGENNTLQPDIEVYNTPEDNLQGNDEQLKRAVELMLKK